MNVGKKRAVNIYKGARAWNEGWYCMRSLMTCGNWNYYLVGVKRIIELSAGIRAVIG